MFTDIEGYTALMQEDERDAVAKCNLYMSVIERYHHQCGGTIVMRLGDGSLSMFPSSLAAVQAGAGIQRELGPAHVPVRIGIHVGEVVVERERLTGDAVNVASRVESFAVAGSLFVSGAAYEQFKNRSDVEVVPLGLFRFKNVGRPMELYAIAGDGLVVPDRALLEGKGERLVALPSSLPEPSSALVGRGSELAALTDLSRAHRVVTITGPGGVGKTRLVIELGRALATEFPDGVAFVGLAEVADPADFLPALAAALDVKESEERSAVDGLVALIGDKRVLLVLDNFEQIVSAAPEVAALVERCPGLRIVTTSRTPLRIDAERTYELAPLAQSPAMALFAERAQRAGPFRLTAETADAVASICARLDGLPLALELAAARVRLLGAEALLERLDHVLDVLTVGRRDSPERQQTLRATIDWSHALLDTSEQTVFRRLAVFAAGCTPTDAEAVTGAQLAQLESLVDMALAQVGRDGRLRMLQTIGEYARERLDASGEAAATAARHA